MLSIEGAEVRALRLIIAAVVTTVWAVTYLAAVIFPDKVHAPAELSAPMLAVVTWALGQEALRGWKIVKENGAKRDERTA